MAFSGTTCSEADIDRKTGANVSVSYDGDMKKAALLEAEGEVMCVIRYDIVTNWATLTALAKALISKVTSSMVAMEAITYDFSGYTSRQEAEAMVTVLNNKIMRGLSILKKQPVKTFLAITT